MQMLCISVDKLASENSEYRGSGGLTKPMGIRLTTAAQCAIIIHSKESDRVQAIKRLERDIMNGPLHCFGHHGNCSVNFCRTIKNQQQPQANNSSAETSGFEDEDIAEAVSGKLP